MDLDIGVTEMRNYTLLDDLSLVSLLVLCSLGPGFPFQQGDHCLAAMVKPQGVLVCVVLAVTRHRCYWARFPRGAVCLMGAKLVCWDCQAVVLLNRVGMFLYLLHFWVPHIQVCQLSGQGNGGLFCGSFSVPITIMLLANSLMGLLAGWD